MKRLAALGLLLFAGCSGMVAFVESIDVAITSRPTTYPTYYSPHDPDRPPGSATTEDLP